MSPLPPLAMGPTVEHMGRHKVCICTLLNNHVPMTRATSLDDSVVKLAFAERREPSVAMAVDDDDVWVGIAS